MRQAIEHGLLLAQRHVFGVFFWFVVLPGPMGAVVYRLAEHVSRVWNRPPASGDAARSFRRLRTTAFAWIDWIPARLTSLGFAIVGDFEGAIYCWRQVARHGTVRRHAVSRLAHAGPRRRQWRARNAAAADSRKRCRHFDEVGNEGAGLAEPTPAALRSVVGLVWRAMLLWLALLLALTLAHWLA